VGGLTISVETNASDVARSFERIVGRHLPFVTAKTLTELAKQGQAQVKSELPERFTIRNTWVARGIRIEPAQKRAWPHVFSVIGTRDEFMVQHQTGEDKRPRRSDALAIPNVAEGGRPGEIVRRSGRIPKRLKPRTLLKGRKAFMQRVKGHWVILQRTTKKRYPVRFLYGMRDSADIKEAWEFDDTVRAVVKKRYEHLFWKFANDAIKPEALRLRGLV
jgi:hypothetical protein